MNSRLCILLFVSMAVVTVKGLPGLADGLWSKLASTSQQSTPVQHLFVKQQSARSFPGAAPVQQPKAKPRTTPKAKGIFPNEAEPKLKLLQEKFAKQQKKQPVVHVKTKTNPSNERSNESEVPVFAKMILGNPARPQLASVEDLRKIDWRTVQTSLELPNAQTIPLVNEMLQKTEELLRVFRELQTESNGFVDDLQEHNRNSNKEYIGYYN
uniref:Uncharacterized protein n=1 Tax=Anopheles funestus TaxID=62324 RepID=A0A4Y0BDF2_ANOFN